MPTCQKSASYCNYWHFYVPVAHGNPWNLVLVINKDLAQGYKQGFVLVLNKDLFGDSRTKSAHISPTNYNNDTDLWQADILDHALS